MATFIGLILVRCGLAGAFTWMELPVAWVYAALVGDYLVKGAMLVARVQTRPAGKPWCARTRWASVAREARLGDRFQHPSRLPGDNGSPAGQRERLIRVEERSMRNSASSTPVQASSREAGKTRSPSC